MNAILFLYNGNSFIYFLGPAVDAGRNSRVVLETAGEVELVGEVQFFGDAGQAVVCGEKQLAGFSHPVSYTHLDVYKRQPPDYPWLSLHR